MSRQKIRKVNKWKQGKVCPKCNKGKLEKAPCHGDGHDHHVCCKTCKTCNF